jgi:type IV secretory pathway TrbL component
MFGIGLPELIILFFVLLPLILWGWALIDVLKSEFTGNNKIIWLLVVIFIPLIGILAYYFVGTKQKYPAKQAM